jgi:hypothetical protein
MGMILENITGGHDVEIVFPTLVGSMLGASHERCTSNCRAAGPLCLL